MNELRHKKLAMDDIGDIMTPNLVVDSYLYICLQGQTPSSILHKFPSDFDVFPYGLFLHDTAQMFSNHCVLS